MKKKPDPPQKPPSIHNWNTSDEEEIERRRHRAQTEPWLVRNLDARFPVFSNFSVQSKSGLTYTVEIRDLAQRRFSCTCIDFRINALGTCKHVEAVLLDLQARFKRLFAKAQASGSDRLDVVPDISSGRLRVEGSKRPPGLAPWIDRQGLVLLEDPEQAADLLRKAGGVSLRISQDVAPWLEACRRAQERKLAWRDYEQKVQSGAWPGQETLVSLYPYQREGMLHLAFTERALLADEMGLGKTIQAIAACALLHRLGKARRALVVAPASLKTEWEEQIQRFTSLPYQLVYGMRSKRLLQYAGAPFFTLVNYEQMLSDSLDVNRQLQPDIVILDEAQRIKNWNTKTAQAVKRLQSRYAFVLTGTPIENRIDDLHSLMSFLEPSVLGPLFRFNRDFYVLDERGRPSGYRHLDQLHERIRPFLLRRRKADVETELPDRTDQRYLVPLSPQQKVHYEVHEATVARLMHIAKSRPLNQQESDKLQRELAMLRMICDTNYILDPKDRICPKLAELEKILDECRQNEGVKVLVFSEWARMLELVQDLCRRMDIGYALHTGTVPQKRRRAEIQLFKTDPRCRVFLSTDSGSTGLNLQNASVVVNCDLPWNPARLEQRIARAWRKHQTRPVTVIHLVSAHTIEQRMLETLAGKQSLADGVLDRRGDLAAIPFRGGKQAFLSRLQQLISDGRPPEAGQARRKVLPVDRALGFSETVRRLLGSACVRCEERYPKDGAHSVLLVVVERDAPLYRDQLSAPFAEYFGKEVSDPLAPVTLEVIDRAGDEALTRLIGAGLLSVNTRFVRELGSAQEAPLPALTDEERLRAEEYRRKAGRKLKMASLLGSGGLPDEEREALLEAGHWAAKALSVERKADEPKTLEEALRPPYAVFWGDSADLLREYGGNADRPSAPVAQALGRILGLVAGSSG